MIKTIMKVAPTAVDAVKAFDNLVDAWKTCKITAEVEQTKRESIKANRDVNIKMIEEHASVLKAYLEHSFKERSVTIQGMFDRLDLGLANGNSELASNAIDAIIAITKQSPLAGAREMLANIKNPAVAMIEI